MDLCSIRDLAAAGIAFCIILYVTLTTEDIGSVCRKCSLQYMML